MTKWARMRRRKERTKANTTKNYAPEENKSELGEPEKISVDTKHHQETQKAETKTFKPNTILSQIPGYIYLIAIFALLSGVFFPLITIGADVAFNFVIGGAATLFLGLSGGILLIKATTSAKRRGIFLTVGFAFIAISSALIFLIQEWWKLEFIRG